jgi:hypothetical protein
MKEMPVMPVHDWTKVVAGNFHDFHQSWITEIRNALNGGILPEDYYALAEQRATRVEPDVLTLEEVERESGAPGLGSGTSTASLVALAEHPPEVRYTELTDEEYYASRADRVAVYHTNGDRVVAYTEIVSPGNKDRRRRLQEFLDKLDAALEQGCHLLVIDVLPPGRHDPQGIHHAFWEGRGDVVHGVTAEEPFGLAAYRVEWTEGPLYKTAYFEPVALGRPLPDMPLFLTPEHYVNVPLEATYLAAWRGVPERWKHVMTGS